MNIRKRTLQAGAVAIMAVAGFCGAAGPAAAAGTWQWYNVDADSCRELAVWSNGNEPALWYDADNDCRVDLHLWRTIESNRYVWYAAFDMDENGYPEAWMLDVTSQPGFEYVWDVRVDRTWRWIGGNSFGVSGNALYSGLVGRSYPGGWALYVTSLGLQ